MISQGRSRETNSVQKSNRLANLKKAVAKNDNIHTLKGYIPPQRSLKYFDQELNC